ncbi:MAG: VanZ family protein [Pyrinomonadaceae bacterium]|nr:VanZ family protein [Pyrinomonadaceae bacterium]
MKGLLERLIYGHGRLSRYVPFLLAVMMIFYLSSGDGSMSNTSRFIRPLLEFLFPGADEATLNVYHAFIRKLAHVGVYAVLAITGSRAFFTSSKSFIKSFWGPAVFIVVIAVASSDEFNQTLDPTRTGSLFDVFLDLAGGLLGIGLFALLIRRVSGSFVDTNTTGEQT